MALQYLLDPAFQVVNTAGKPATGGYINVFIHGTREKYYCASDFNGTLHPFNIPLDSLGSNVVLADDSRAYDVYVYNRYGTQLYSRYNVKSSAGGGISSTEIISSDGSVTVTNTANGVDLSVNGVKPSVLRAGTVPRTSDGSFTFTFKEREGDDITLDQGGIKLAKGWYHYDVSVEIEWNAPAENRSVPVIVTAANGAARDELDLTFSHTDSLTLCGELHNPSVDLMDFEVAASGIPTGATVRVKEVGIHTVHGAGAGGSGEKNVHRLLRWYTNAGEAEYPAGDWLHDLDAEDPNDPSGHPRVTADQLFEWFGEGQNFELYEVDGRNGQLGWSAVYRMVTWQDQSEWWSQFAPEPGKAVRLEFFRMGMYSTPYRGGLIAYIRYKDEEYMRLYEIMPGQSVWIAEYQEKLPYYSYNWHNGDYLRVSEAGTGLEWASLPPQVNADWNAVSGPGEVLNKPEIPTKTSDLDNDSGFITLAEVPAQVNSDWNAVSGPEMILNKPSIPTKTSDLQNDSGFITAAQVPEQVNADWNATSGVSEILNKPTIPSGAQLVPAATASDEDKVLTVNSQGIPEWAEKDGADLFYVTYNVTTYDEIKAAHDAGKWPVLVDSSGRVAPMTRYNWIGTSSSIQYVEFQARDYDFHSNNAGADYYEVVYHLQLEFDPDLHRTETWSTTSHYSSADWNAVSGPRAIRNKPTLAAVATSGSYSDLSNTPTIPTATSDLTNDSGYITLAEVPSQVNSDWDATSGASEILNKPKIKPIVAGTNITIMETSTGVEISAQGGGTEQVNADWDAVSGPAEILHKPTIPTNTSDLNNDSGFITASQVPAQVNSDWNATSGAAEILNKPNIKPIVAGANITITESSTGVEIAAAAQVNSDWDAVSGPEEILNKPQTAPLVAGTNITITETQNGIEIAAQGSGSSVNADWDAVSGPSEILNKPDLTLYATKAELDTKEDEFAAGTGLEFTTDGQGNRVLQVEAPVDIVAGPGIVIDNPDGNTLRVSVAKADKTVLWEGTATNSCSLSETPANFEELELTLKDPNGKSTKVIIGPTTATAWPTNIPAFGPGSAGIMFCWVELSGTTLTISKAKIMSTDFAGNNANWAYDTSSGMKNAILKVVGVHRIANN